MQLDRTTEAGANGLKGDVGRVEVRPMNWMASAEKEEEESWAGPNNTKETWRLADSLWRQKTTWNRADSLAIKTTWNWD